MNYFAECLARFQALPDNFKEAFGSVQVYSAIKAIEDKYQVKLSFLVILVALGELEEDDLPEYLSLKFKLAPEQAKKITAELVDQVLDPAFVKSLELPPTNTNSLVISKENIINLFSKRLVEALKASPDTIRGLNVLIFKALQTEEDLEDLVISALYSNSEIVTPGRLLSEGREIPASVSNWLKDFIKLNGSEIFDEVVLAQYLVDSPNVKKLNLKDKRLVRRLLKLYRNLVFFPESMDRLPVEEWEIIPIDKLEDRDKNDLFLDSLSDKLVTPAVKTSKAAPSEATRPSSSSVAPKPVSRKVESIASPIEPDNSLTELEQTLSNYQPDSLEHKAVSQEISRLRKLKKK